MKDSTALKQCKSSIQFLLIALPIIWGLFFWLRWWQLAAMAGFMSLYLIGDILAILRIRKKQKNGMPVVAVPKLSHKADARTIKDSVLGLLYWSEEDEMWETEVNADNTSIRFLIAGEPDPDSALLKHASDIARELSNFRRSITTFLAEESRNQKYLRPFAEEIRQLAIEDVCLMWPNRPNDGMIYFTGPDEIRCWRCDYVNRKPKGLGFDD